MKRFVFIIFLGLILSSCKEQAPPTFFDPILESGSSNLKKVISNKDKFEVQVLFSPITRRNDSIIIEDHFFNFRPDDYFYPASTVKMPVAFLALQKLEELRSAGIDIDRDTPLKIDSLRPVHTPVMSDTTSNNSLPSIGHYIEKVFAISDNDAYNRLYEFTNQDYINAHLRNKQIFTNSRIVHRVGVGGFSYEENKFTPSINFLDSESNTIHTVEATYSQSQNLTPLGKTKKGKAYIDQNDNKIDEPFDFGKKNFINIKDLQESLKRIVFPELYPHLAQYNMIALDREFVLQSMAKLPKDHHYLKGKTDEYYDSYVKFFLFGDSKDPIPDHIIIRNKVGVAYGYLTDCAYITDTKENIEYFLTATIHVNDNQIYNDGVYEYDDVGIPFLAELGRLVHAYMIDQK